MRFMGMLIILEVYRSIFWYNIIMQFNAQLARLDKDLILKSLINMVAELLTFKNYKRESSIS